MSLRNKAVANDNMILATSHYYCSQGYTKPTDGIEYLQKVNAKFMEFKKLILNGEFTMIELENDVYSKYGVVNETPLEALNEMSKSFKKRDKVVDKH